MATVATAKMTAEEFFAWSNRPENAGKRCELVEGEVVEMPPPGDVHGTICAWITYLFWDFARRRGRGRVTSNDTGLVVERDPDTTRGADVMFFDESRGLDELPSSYPTGVPRVVVEVMSPSDRWTKTRHRVQQYLGHGVPLIWVVDPIRRTVTVFRPDELQQVLDETDTLTGNGVLPDFECKVAELFALPGAAPTAL
jgi:Uma2 family endonuclease